MIYNQLRVDVKDTYQPPSYPSDTTPGGHLAGVAVTSSSYWDVVSPDDQLHMVICHSGQQCLVIVNLDAASD